MKYTVHIYPICRVTLLGIEADSQEEAIKKAEAQANLYALCSAGVEYAEGIDSFHVDEENDPHYERSCSYDGDGKTIGGGKTK